MASSFQEDFVASDSIGTLRNVICVCQILGVSSAEYVM